MEYNEKRTVISKRRFSLHRYSSCQNHLALATSGCHRRLRARSSHRLICSGHSSFRLSSRRRFPPSMANAMNGRDEIFQPEMGNGHGEVSQPETQNDRAMC